MPRGDGTGPMGMGSMSGRGAGFCAGFNMPGFANRGVGMGPGLGRRAGFRAAGAGGWRGEQTVTADDDKKALRHQLDVLQRQMDAIKKRLGETE